MDFYKRHYEDDGWRRFTEKDLGSSKILIMQKRGARVELVVSRSPEGQSVAVINQVEEHG